jgi:hypothetical protein
VPNLGFATFFPSLYTSTAWAGGRDHTPSRAPQRRAVPPAAERQLHLLTSAAEPEAFFVITGCGLLGLSLAAAFACSAVITDVEQVLPLVRGNVQRNLPQLPQPPRVMPLDWQSAADLRAVVAHGPFDVLVATDVVRLLKQPSVHTSPRTPDRVWPGGVLQFQPPLMLGTFCPSTRGSGEGVLACSQPPRRVHV